MKKILKITIILFVLIFLLSKCFGKSDKKKQEVPDTKVKTTATTVVATAPITKAEIKVNETKIENIKSINIDKDSYEVFEKIKVGDKVIVEGTIRAGNEKKEQKTLGVMLLPKNKDYVCYITSDNRMDFYKIYVGDKIKVKGIVSYKDKTGFRVTDFVFVHDN